MEQSGVIQRYTALLDREKLGLHVCALAHIHLTRHTEGGVEQFEREIATCPEVTECYSTTGESDYILKIVAPDIKAYDAFCTNASSRFRPSRKFARASCCAKSSSIRNCRFETVSACERDSNCRPHSVLGGDACRSLRKVDVATLSARLRRPSIALQHAQLAGTEAALERVEIDARKTLRIAVMPSRSPARQHHLDIEPRAQVVKIDCRSRSAVRGERRLDFGDHPLARSAVRPAVAPPHRFPDRRESAHRARGCRSARARAPTRQCSAPPTPKSADRPEYAHRRARSRPSCACAIRARRARRASLISSARTSSAAASSSARSDKSCSASQPNVQPIRATMKPTIAAAIGSSRRTPARLPIMPIATTSDDAASERACHAFAINMRRTHALRFAQHIAKQRLFRNQHQHRDGKRTDMNGGNILQIGKTRRRRATTCPRRQQSAAHREIMKQRFHIGCGRNCDRRRARRRYADWRSARQNRKPDRQANARRRRPMPANAQTPR